MGMNENSQTDEGSNLSLSGLPTVIDAIQKAGGLTKQANITEVVLKRKLPGNENKYKFANLNLYSLIFDGNQINNPYLFDGDIIRIKKAAKDTEKILEVANANLSTQNIRVNVIGEVYNPGILNLPSNSLLSQGVIAAGGPINSRSKISNIVLYRVNRNGKVISATPGAKGSTTTNTYLYSKAKEAALKTTFEANTSAPEIQVGTIIYNFKLN